MTDRRLGIFYDHDVIMGGMKNEKRIYQTYLKLIGAVDHSLSLMKKKYGAAVNCKPGCDECCSHEFTVFIIEGYHIRQGFEKLALSERLMVESKALVYSCMSDAEAAQAECPFLYNHRCIIYQNRPLICRTHGWPVKVQINDDGEFYVDACKYNFRNLPIKGLPEVDLLNLDELNAMLVRLNRKFCEALNGCNPHKAVRMHMWKAILQDNWE